MENNTIFTKYLEARGPKVNKIKVECFYSLGGMNYFTGKSEPRGYYLSATPVEVSDNGRYRTEAYVGFSGKKILIKPVSRKSSASAEIAKARALCQIECLVEAVCVANDVVLVGGDE